MAALPAKLMALSGSPTRHAGQRIMQSARVARLGGARVIGVRQPKQRQRGMADLVGKVRRERVAPDEGFRAAKKHAKLRQAAVVHAANVGVAWLWGPQDNGLKTILSKQEVYQLTARAARIAFERPARVELQQDAPRNRPIDRKVFPALGGELGQWTEQIPSSPPIANAVASRK